MKLLVLLQQQRLLYLLTVAESSFALAVPTSLMWWQYSLDSWAGKAYCYIEVVAHCYCFELAFFFSRCYW